MKNALTSTSTSPPFLCMRLDAIPDKLRKWRVYYFTLGGDGDSRRVAHVVLHVCAPFLVSAAEHPTSLTTLPLYRISTTRSPLSRACSMRGHGRSKASIKELVRQIPAIGDLRFEI
jgi:hypothetical protein